MGSNYKSYGGGKSCGCNKRVRKAQRVPQRGPGVAELEKILSDQKHDHMKPSLYATNPNGQPPLHHHHHLMGCPTTQPMTIHLPRPFTESHFTITRPHTFYPQQPSRMIVENAKSIAEQEKIMLRNILTLGPSALPLNPTLIESDSSEEQCKDKKPDQSQIFSFNMTDNFLSLDDTKLSLHHNAARAEELGIDLTLKL